MTTIKSDNQIMSNNHTVLLEYVWLDGNKPEPTLRSKVKVHKLDSDDDGFPQHLKPEDCPEWSYDGSSTNQADGNFSDCLLKPVRIYNKGVFSNTYFVLCEVLNPDGTPHETNTRSSIGKEDEDIWFGFEQEYTIMDGERPAGFPSGGFPEPQGPYYCGVGSKAVIGRNFAEKHLQECLQLGIEVTGINAEVMKGQWEFQVLGKGKLKAGDDLWMCRYMLHRLAESTPYTVEFHPKPVKGDWNGSGLHCNFSDTEMREGSNKQYYEDIFEVFKNRHEDHIKVYGSDNHERLTGLHETASIEEFSVGESDRGASIRIPVNTTKSWNGYLEDRRPASNADPYKITKVISESLYMAKHEKMVEASSN